MVAALVLPLAGARTAAADTRRLLAELDTSFGAPVGEGRIDEFNLATHGGEVGLAVGVPRAWGAVLLRTQVAWAGGSDGAAAMASVGPVVRLARTVSPVVSLHGDLHLGPVVAVPRDGGSWLGLGATARVAGGLTWWPAPTVGVGAEVALTTFAYGYGPGDVGFYGPTLLTAGAALRFRL